MESVISLAAMSMGVACYFSRSGLQQYHNRCRLIVYPLKDAMQRTDSISALKRGLAHDQCSVVNEEFIYYVIVIKQIHEIPSSHHLQ